MFSRFLLPVLALSLSAIPASAGIAQAFDHGECYVFWSANEQDSCQASSFEIGGNPNWNGISFHTPYPVPSFNFQSQIPADIEFSNVVGMGTYFFAPDGTFNQDTFPIRWDFTVNAKQEGSFNWYLDIYRLVGDESIYLFSDSSSASFNTQILGFGETGSLNGPFGNIYMELFVGSNSGPFSVFVPGGATVDFNAPAADVAAPEPGTIFLGGAALLGLAGLKARRRRSA